MLHYQITDTNIRQHVCLSKHLGIELSTRYPQSEVWENKHMLIILVTCMLTFLAGPDYPDNSEHPKHSGSTVTTDTSDTSEFSVIIESSDTSGISKSSVDRGGYDHLRRCWGPLLLVGYTHAIYKPFSK